MFLFSVIQYILVWCLYDCFIYHHSFFNRHSNHYIASPFDVLLPIITHQATTNTAILMSRGRGSSRFWIEKIPIMHRSSQTNQSTGHNNISDLDISNVKNSDWFYRSNITSQFAHIRQQALERNIFLDKVNMGLMISNPPSTSSDRQIKQRIVPIHNGILQHQHTNYISIDSSDEIYLCGFSPRAAHTVTDTSNDDDNSYGDDYDYMTHSQRIKSNYSTYNGDGKCIIAIDHSFHLLISHRTDSYLCQS